ncbi:MAG: TIGR04086 family membrane protein [Lachnospiraceae bacterium]|nr:TIGR04086 family membrane protein [Lachnospiraceae bacterium]
MEQRILPSPARILGRALLFEALVSVFLLLAASAVFTLAGPGFSAIPVVARAIWFLASLTGGFLAARAAGSRRLLWGLAAGLGCLLVLLLLSLIFSMGSAHASAWFWCPLLCLVGGGIGGGLS